MLRYFSKILRATRRKFVLPKVPAQIEVLVVSAGGVGTTMVLEQLERFVRVNDPYDRDGLKHLPRPPKFANTETRTIFLTGPTDDIYESLEHRGWVDAHASLLGSMSTLLATPSTKRRHLAAAIRQQYLAWSEHRGKILFVSYNEIWDRLPEIAGFLDLGATELVATFPKRRPRTSARLDA